MFDFRQPYHLTREIPHHQRPDEQDSLAFVRAQQLFREAKRRGWFYRRWEGLRRRSYKLFDMQTISSPGSICSSTHLGILPVVIHEIIGSEGRHTDFDLRFHPINNHNRKRWENIALIRMLGVTLPAVELIRVEGRYFVRDGNHRISVAYALDQTHIDALVTEVRLNISVPWSSSKS